MLHLVDLILWLHLILCKCCVQTNLTAYLPSTPLTSSWSQSHTSPSDYLKHCRDRDDVSGVLRCDSGEWERLAGSVTSKNQEILQRNLFEMPNDEQGFIQQQLLGSKHIPVSLLQWENLTGSSLALCLDACMPLLPNRSFPPYTSLCRRKTVSTHLQKLRAQEGAMVTYNYMRKKIYYGKNTTSISFLPWEGDSSPHPICDAICILYIHAHILYWLLNGHHISYAYLC